MQEFLTYNLKVAVCLATFYLFYKLLLSRETFHRLNRAVLAGAMVLSFLLPVCRVTLYRYVEVSPVVGLPEVTVFAEAVGQPAGFDWTVPAAALFAAGVAAMLLRMVLSVGAVVRVIREGRHERLDSQAILVRLSREIAPFSWIRWIVVSERDLAANGDTIIAHERAHIRLHHSYDLIVTDLLAMLQWFNPAMWLLRAELRAVHEYEADAAVLAGGADAHEYQMLLIEKAVGGKWCSVANSLNHSKLKNRITMMLRKKSSRWASARVLFVLPLVCVAAAAFARTEVVPVTPAVGDKVTENYPIDEISPDNPQTKAAKTPDGDAYLMCEVMPTFNGGNINDFRTWVMSNIRYPQQAQEQGVQGVVVASFVVGTDGRVEDVTILRSPDELLSAEARRVIDKSPAWTPGTQEGKAVRVKLTVPVQFRLYGEEETEAAEPDVKGSVDKITVVGYGAPKKTEEKPKEAVSVLYMVDGREAEGISDLAPENIESITVLKEETAVERYGEKGRNGVIIVKTRKEAAAPACAKDEPVRVVSVGTYKKTEEQSDEKTIVRYEGNISYTNAKSAIWIVDGREVTEEEAKNIDSDNIESITVLKGAVAVAEYGERAKEGVIRIRIKNGKQTGSTDNIKGIMLDRAVFEGQDAEYYIDGKEVTADDVKALPSDRITNINVNKSGNHTRVDIRTKGSEGETVSQVDWDAVERKVELAQKKLNGIDWKGINKKVRVASANLPLYDRVYVNKTVKRAMRTARQSVEGIDWNKINRRVQQSRIGTETERVGTETGEDE